MRKALTTSVWCLALALMVFSGTNAFADSKDYNLDWYGYFKLDGAWDQNLTSHGNFVMWVNPKSIDEDDAQFNMTANQTRLGVKMSGAEYDGAAIGGKIEFDLYAGVGGATITQDKPMLQLRHAYFTVEKDGWKLLAGQSWDIISPLNPSTINYPVLWGVGNIGYRRAQVSVFRTIGEDDSKVTIAAGAFRTIGSDLTPTFTLALGETTEGADDGTDAAIPTLQGLLDVQHKFESGMALRLGASGMWGQLKAETNFGNSEKYESWLASGHMKLSFPGGHGISAEAYTGVNTGGYFGGILNSSTIDGVKSTGGWASAWVQATPKVKLSGGFGLDDPKDDDIGSGSRSQNRAIYGNIQYKLLQPVSIGLEVSHWKTDYKDGDSAKTLRAQTAFTLNF